MKLFPFRNSSLLLALLSVVGLQHVQAQTKEILSAYKAKYPGQHIVFTKNVVKITIKMVKDVPVVQHTNNWEYLVLDKNGVVSLSDESIEFSSFETLGDIEAYSLIPTEKGSKKVPATDFQTRDAEAEGSVFHDDARETSFIYPNICEGALRVLNYETTMTDYHFPFGFTFDNYIPMENATFIIETDTAVHVMTRLFNTDGSGIVFTEKTEKNKRIMTWTIPTSKVMKEEESAPAYRYYWPHVLGQIDYYTSKKGRVNAIGTPKDLHEYYKSNVAEVVNEEPSTELKTIAETVTKGLTTDLDKAKAIYYWVQDNIKYIAFEEGMGGYIPRQPSRVISKRYGDCKDMASVIYSMLKSVNVPSYLTWIGSRDLPYKYTEFPSSYCDNHMITVFKDNGKLYFLDATNSTQPYDMPTGFIQGKQAMLHINDNEYEIVEVPVPDAGRTFMSDTSRITISGRDITGTSHTTIGGYYHSMLSTYFKDVPEKEMTKAINSINQKGNNSYLVTSGKLTNVKERDLPMYIDCSFKISNYATSFDNEVYVNMVLEKDVVYNGELKKERTAPLEMDNRTLDSYTVILSVPDGYNVKSIPKNVSYETDLIDYSVTYKQEGRQISMTLSLKLDFLLLPKEQFAAWNEFIALKKASTSESVVLIKQ
jgi:transglutaminase-like putative cysteine protease